MEGRSCENCYWKLNGDKWCTNMDLEPSFTLCDEHNYVCKCGEQALFNHGGEPYCADCIMKGFNVEVYTKKMYYLDGEFIGDEDDDITDIIQNLDDDIQELEL